MSQNLTITITAKDGSSQVFRTIGSSATSMSNSIKSAATGASGSLDKVGSSATKAGSGVSKAGSEASKAATGFDKLDNEAKGAASSLDKFEASATKIGAALGTGVAILSRFGQQAETQRRQVDGIQKAYGDAADEILEFADAIQSATKFSNEDAREAAQIAATLAQNYGFTTAEIEKLITVSSDLAAIKGIDLADAVQRTSAAMRGEAESAEFLGLTLNQQAIDREGLTLSMSNEEAAHFRLNALLEQSAYAEGAAGEAAATAAGQAAQFGNAVQDIGTKIGAALGPLAGATAGLADMALILPVIGAGIGKAAASFPKMAQGATALIGAINPIGLAITAAAVAGGILVHSIQEQSQAAADAEASYVTLASAIDQVADASARADLRSSTIFQSSETQGAEGFFRNLGATVAGTSKNFDEYTISGQEAAEANRLVGDTALKAGDEVGRFASDTLAMRQAVDEGALTGDQLIEVLDGINKAFSYTGEGASLVQDETLRVVDAWRAGEIGAQGMVDGVSRITENVGAYADGMIPAIEATKELTEAQKAASRADVVAGLEGQSKRYEALADSIERANEAFLAPSLASGAGFGLALDEKAIADIERYGDELDAAAEEQEAARQAMIDTANALRGELVPALDGASSGFASLARPGEDALDVLDRLAPTVENVGGSLLQLSDGLNDAAQGMDAILSVFSAIDSLGGRASGAASIAEKLVGEPGTWATIDDLLTNATISQETYNDAVQAGYGIQAKNAEIQDSLNGIRAQQLPLLDQQTASYRAYIDRLSEASVAEQQQALYLMDSANQAKVAASYSTAYAASLGEIPADVATEIIADGAQADPILGDILEKFGLIEVGADGEVRVNFPDAATLDDVTAAIDNLTETTIEVAVATSGAEEAQAVLAATSDNLNEIDGRTATATVSVKLDAGLASGAGFGAALDDATSAAPEAITVPVKADTSAVESALKSLETERTVTVKVDADTSAFDTALGGVGSDSGGGVKITIDAEDNASSVVARAMQAANAFDGQTYTAALEATDSSGSVVAQAMQAANAFAVGEYNASLVATDSASQVIAIPQGAATAFAVGEYNASLVATDSASSIIDSATSAASAFATTYTATLNAVDNATGVINSVANALAALDGTTATTYVTTQEIASLPPARKLGGAILPGAKLGRAVQVGEAGPETVTLPYGSMVQPSPASQNATPDTTKGDRASERAAKREERATERIEKSLKRRSKAYEDWIDKLQEADDAIRDAESAEGYEGDFTARFASLTPKVDLKKAYKLGGDSAEAFFDGLLSIAKDRVSDQESEIADTIYPSKESADAALADLRKFRNERDKLKNKKEKGAEFDKDTARAARQAERELERLEARAAKAASRVGKDISTGVSTGTDEAETSISGVSTKLGELNEVTAVPTINVDASDAVLGIGSTKTGLQQIENTTATADVNIKVDDSAWQAIKSEIDGAQLGVTVTIKTKEKSASSEGKKLGGAILADEVPAAALGRVITVGEAGPEAVVLPFGAQVIPSPASASRLNAERQSGNINIYAPVHVYPPTADIGAAIYGQLVGQGRS